MTYKHVLAFGAGVDSTTLLAIDLDRMRSSALLGMSLYDLNRAFPRLDAVVFADPGAEFPETYRNVDIARDRATAAGRGFAVVRHPRETITEWLLRNGNLPLLPGGRHVCSLKFKGEVMQRWAAARFPDRSIRWAIGIGASEDRRSKRFTAKKAARHQFTYPLRSLDLDRGRCLDILAALGWPVTVRKSSCVFCPFMTHAEIRDLRFHHPEQWAKARKIEATFRATSPVKHAAWIDAGRPRRGKDGRGPAPPGMWSRDAWAEGARLFLARVGGNRLSIDEWERQLPSR